MTIEEKAKVYDEALERYKAKQEYESNEVRKFIEFLFPELAEDEKIRTALIDFFKSPHAYDDFKGIPFEKIVAWLEKQCEQKPILPKWKYKNDSTPLLRDSLILNKYGCVAKSPSGAIVSDVWVIDYDELAKLPKEEYDKQGEQKPVEWSEEDETKLNDVIRLIENSGHVESIRKHYIDWLKSLRPQKQQYEDEWSDEDKEFLKWTLSNLAELKDRYGEDYGKVGKCIDWLNSLQPQPIDVEAAIAYQEGYQKAVVEFSQKQQEWTDEDINMIDWLIRCCEKEHEELCNDRYGHQDIVSDLKRDCRKKWDWLESLKGKVAPQKHWKPTEEQIQAIEEALSLAKNCGEEYSFDLRKLLEQLKAL